MFFAYNMEPDSLGFMVFAFMIKLIWSTILYICI